MANLPQLIYQYLVIGKYSKETCSIILETDNDLISRLVFNFDWLAPFEKYSKRLAYYWGFSLSGGEDTFLEGKIESITDDLSTFVYLVEVSVVPEKLEFKDREHLVQLVDELKDDTLLTIWWSGLAKNKNKKKQKYTILEDLGEMPQYQKEDDVDFAVIEEPSIEDCLEGLGFSKDSSKNEIAPVLKNNIRVLQKKYHPDICGDDVKFKQIQVFKEILETWIAED